MSSPAQIARLALLGLTLSICAAATAANPSESPDSSERCAETYSILRDSSERCASPLQSQSRPPKSNGDEKRAPDAAAGPDPGWLRAEMAAFAVIGIAQVRGGTSLLRDVWYSGAVLVPPFMTTDAEYGLRKNYLAVSPPFVALGVINDYLHRDRADDARIFLTNFIAFNVGLLWSRNVLDNPGHFLQKSSTRLAWLPAIDADNRYGLVSLNFVW